MRVAEHAGGNPLFIVEITGMLLRDDRAVPERGSAPPRLLPPTVQAVVASRMDHLSPDARELVRRASIFARGVFDVSELELVADPRMDLLEELEDEELLVRDPERPTVWRFRADVLRDVAYDSLAKRERQRLHLRVATKLSEPETADRHPRAIAYHLEQAALAALDLEPGDRTLADRAVEALSHAGDVARGRVESRAAAESYEHALALAGAESGWGEREAWILKGLGEARYWLGEYEAAERAFERALEVAGEASVRVRVHASRFLADLALTFRGDLDRAAELFGHATLAARELDSDRVLARTLLMAAWVPYWRGELERARAMFEEALAISSEDPWAGSRALVGLASVVSPAGDEEEALGLALRALAVGEESGHAFTTAVAHEKTALCLRRLLRLDEALEHSDRAVATYRELGARWELASALDDRGVIHRLAGRLDEAERDLRESLRLSLELEERALGPWSAADLARVLVMKGDPVEARSLLDEHGSRSTPGESGPVPAVLAADAHVAYATGDAETARERSIAAVEAERRSGPAPNHLATLVWWTARLFGDDAVGGEAVAREARDRLERNHWRQALVEPELVLEAAPAGR
jgi:tetratricopeptide (TPR) repeat protein